MFVPKGQKQPAVLSILKAGSKYLLLKRGKEPNFGLYSPVGGKIDAHESPKHATVRETFEEAGIKITNPKFCGTIVETSPTKYNWICFVYYSEVEYSEPIHCKEGVVEWIDERILADTPIPKTDVEIYKLIKENKHFQLAVEYDENMNILSFVDELNGVDYSQYIGMKK
ncbi:MAG: NUDIX domain-containing protein [Candidatus Marinimicrobia bacterium]|nr:NUDIX domain-containing protein [Candidatus Neomarinimicrobiota bacterium]